MVKVQRLKSNRRCANETVLKILVLIALTLALLIHQGLGSIHWEKNEGKTQLTDSLTSPSFSCEYKSLSDLKHYEAYPKVSKLADGNNRRHAFEPPEDGVVSLVCCETTAGPLSVAVHENWAPLGAARFLSMVQNNYFSSKIALMRCVRNFICQ